MSIDRRRRGRESDAPEATEAELLAALRHAAWAWLRGPKPPAHSAEPESSPTTKAAPNDAIETLRRQGWLWFRQKRARPGREAKTGNWRQRVGTEEARRRAAEPRTFCGKANAWFRATRARPHGVSPRPRRRRSAKGYPKPYRRKECASCVAKRGDGSLRARHRQRRLRRWSAFAVSTAARADSATWLGLT